MQQVGGRSIRTLVLAQGLDLAERHTLAGLHDRGVDLHVLLGPDFDVADEFLRDRGVSVEILDCRSRVDLPAARRIREVLKSRHFDIMHGLLNRPLANGLWAAWGMRDLRRVGYRGTSGHISRFDPASWMTYLHPRLDRIVCVSDSVRQYLRGVGLAESKLRVIRKGHDPDWYQTAARARLGEFGIPPDAVVIVMVGAIRPVKGVEYLLRAWEHLPAGHRAHLLLVGAITDRKVLELLERSPCRERFHATGFRSDAAALAGACDLAAMVTVEREGLPRAIMEAQAQGVPALVTNVGGMPEIIEDGFNGYVVPPRDAEAIARAIVRAFSQPEELERLGTNTRTRFAERFSVGITIEQTMALYEELMAEDSPPNRR